MYIPLERRPYVFSQTPKSIFNHHYSYLAPYHRYGHWQQTLNQQTFKSPATLYTVIKSNVEWQAYCIGYRCYIRSKFIIPKIFPYTLVLVLWRFEIHSNQWIYYGVDWYESLWCCHQFQYPDMVNTILFFCTCRVILIVPFSGVYLIELFNRLIHNNFEAVSCPEFDVWFSKCYLRLIFTKKFIMFTFSLPMPYIIKHIKNNDT